MRAGFTQGCGTAWQQRLTAGSALCFFDKVYKEPAQNLRALCLEALYPS